MCVISAGASSTHRPSVWTLNELVLDTPLTAVEKRFLVLVERGDVASTKRLSMIVFASKNLQFKPKIVAQFAGLTLLQFLKIVLGYFFLK
jgi:hypothetical protein